SRETALREIARAFLTGAGLTVPGELARVTGLSRPDAGLGNRALVRERFAEMPARGVYHLARPGATQVSEKGTPRRALRGACEAPNGDSGSRPRSSSRSKSSSGARARRAGPAAATAPASSSRP